MCPLCDENLGCKYWDLKKSCTLTKVIIIEAMLEFLFDMLLVVPAENMFMVWVLTEDIWNVYPKFRFVILLLIDGLLNSFVYNT